jgi:antitoxin (DNA-binding transcriptional repressor) of toxin-antitoxin stability system
MVNCSQGFGGAIRMHQAMDKKENIMIHGLEGKATRSLSPPDIETISVSELRVNLARYKRDVQFGKRRIAATSYGETVGFLIGVAEAQSIRAISNTIQVPITEFRDNLSEKREQLYGDIDCIFLLFHNRPVAAFVGKHLENHLQKRKATYAGIQEESEYILEDDI